MIVSRPEIRTLKLDDTPAPSPLAEKIKRHLSKLPAPYVAALREQGVAGRISFDRTHVTFSMTSANEVVFCAIDNAAMVTLERAATMLRVSRQRGTTGEVASDLPMGTLEGKPVFRDRLFGGAGMAGAMWQHKLHTLWDEVGVGLHALRSAAVEKQRELGPSAPEVAVAEAAVASVSKLVDAVGRQILAASVRAPKDPMELPKVQ